MNYRLHGFSERAWLFEDLNGEYAAEQFAHNRRRMSDFASSARHHGFAFREINSRGRQSVHWPAAAVGYAIGQRTLARDEPGLGSCTSGFSAQPRTPRSTALHECLLQ